MTVAAPVITQEMAEWTALGGGNSGIVGDPNHTYGFHCSANSVSADDYSRWRDPNGSDGPFTDWNYACAGDFSHKNDPNLRAMHAGVLNRLMSGEMPMICEFIGKPWADKPVYYWARWNGIGNLQKYTGSGHDHWSHISWYRSRAHERAGLWVAGGGSPVPPEEPAYLRRQWPGYMKSGHYFGHYLGPNESHGGWYQNERPDCAAIQQRLHEVGFNPGPVDGWIGDQTVAAIADWQRRDWSATTTLYGQFWYDDWYHMFTY